MDPNKGYTKATFTPNKSTAEERKASLFDHVTGIPSGVRGILVLLQGGPEELRSEWEGRGRSELRKIEVGFGAAAKGPDAVRSELQKRAKIRLVELRAGIDMATAELERKVAVLDAERLMDYIRSPEFEAFIRERFDGIGDTEQLIAAIQTGVTTEGLPRTMVDFQKMVGAIKILLRSLDRYGGDRRNRNEGLTLAIEWSSASGEVRTENFMDRLIQVLGSRGALVNELIVDGTPKGYVKRLKVEGGVVVRQANVRKPVVVRNDQKVVPLIASGITLPEMDSMFRGILSDALLEDDPMSGDFLDVLKVVVGIHMAMAIREGAVEPKDLQQELMRRLGLFEEGQLKELIQLTNNGQFMISSVAAQVYLSMLARQSIAQSA
jgi:hypothetical protein